MTKKDFPKPSILPLYKVFLNALILGASLILAFISLGLIVQGVMLVYERIVLQSVDDKILLQAIELIVLAIAVFDVAKYLVEEEFTNKKELKNPAEARQTLTKFLVIIIIAVSLEALLYIFQAGHENLKLLIYPAFLLLVTVSLVVGLAVFQKMSINTEKKILEKRSLLKEE